MAAYRSGTRPGGRLVLLTGPTGAGKTHRAERMAEEARASGTPVGWAACGRPGAPPLAPWRTLLRTITATGHARAPGTGREAAPLLDAGDDIGADLRARYDLFERVADALTDIASRQAGPTPGHPDREATAGLMLVLDDLHAADAASLALTQHLAAGIHSLPLTLVATVRTDLPPPRPEWPAAWAELVRLGEVVPVGPLPDSEIAALVARAVGRPDPDLARRISQRTDGHALFVSALVRWCTSPGGDVETLPDTVRTLVAGRVAALGPDCRRVLSAAATIGDDAEIVLLGEILGQTPDQVRGAAAEAVEHGLLLEKGTDRVTFVHDLVRTSVYEAQPPAHRAHWHRRVGRSLAARTDAAGAAHHLRAGGPESHAEAARWFVRAGEESLAALAYEDAATQFAAALACAPDAPGRVQLLLGRAAMASGDVSGARTALLAAVDAARVDADAGLMTEAALGLGAGPSGFEVPLFDREQIAALEDALALVGDQPTPARAMLLARLAVATTFTAPTAHRAELAGEAVTLARGCADPPAVAVALTASVDVIAGPQHLDERLALTSEAVTIARRERDAALELLARRQRIVARLERGDLAGADEDVREYRAVAAALAQPTYSWYVPLWTAALAFARGELGAAATAVAEARELGERAGSANAQLLVSSHQWSGGAELADPARMVAAVGGGRRGRRGLRRRDGALDPRRARLHGGPLR